MRRCQHITSFRCFYLRTSNHAATSHLLLRWLWMLPQWLIIGIFRQLMRGGLTVHSQGRGIHPTCWSTAEMAGMAHSINLSGWWWENKRVRWHMEYSIPDCFGEGSRACSAWWSAVVLAGIMAHSNQPCYMMTGKWMHRKQGAWNATYRIVWAGLTTEIWSFCTIFWAPLCPWLTFSAKSLRNSKSN